VKSLSLNGAPRSATAISLTMKSAAKAPPAIPPEPSATTLARGCACSTSMTRAQDERAHEEGRLGGCAKRPVCYLPPPNTSKETVDASKAEAGRLDGGCTFKAKVAMAAVREEQTVPELAALSGSPNPDL